MLLHPVKQSFQNLPQLVNCCHIDGRLHQGDNAHFLTIKSSQSQFLEKEKTFSWKCFCEVCTRAEAATANATTSNPVVCWGGEWQNCPTKSLPQTHAGQSTGQRWQARWRCRCSTCTQSSKTLQPVEDRNVKHNRYGPAKSRHWV